MKIPKMSKTKIRQWIRACKELLKHYKKHNKIMEECPLCSLGKTQENLFECFGDCPWHWFLGKHCMNIMDRHWSNKTCAHKPSFFKLRLRQLPKWIEKLEALL